MFDEEHVNILHDDTYGRAGQHFATRDLIYIPWQIIIGSKQIGHGLVEIKHRNRSEIEDLLVDMAVA